MVRKLLLLFAVIALLLVIPRTVAESGGPDSFGYSFKDSEESDGPVYNWVDIQDNGTTITDPGDQVVGPYDIGFDFFFYGEWYNQWWLGGDNGWISLDKSVTYAWTPNIMPAGAIPGTAIAPLWQDWQYCNDDNATSEIYYELTGTAPDRVFVIQFEQLRKWYQTCTNTVTFEVLIFEETNNIVFQYKDTTANGWDGVASVGIQGTGTHGLSYTYGEMNNRDNLAVEFYAPPPPNNELILSLGVVDEIIDLEKPSTFWAEIRNKGVNNQTGTNVNIEVYTFRNETNIDENFSDGDPDNWTHGIFSGTRDGWGTGTGEDYYNRGKNGSVQDGEAMSAGRKGNESTIELANETTPYNSWLQMPTIDMSTSVGGTLTFSHSWAFYYLYEGAYLEASTDGGSTWTQVTDFTRGGYQSYVMTAMYNNPYGGMKGWSYYCFSNYNDMIDRTDGEGDKPYIWGDVELDLTPWIGETLDIRWRVGYNSYFQSHVNSWYRLDDVKVELLYIESVVYNETTTIDSIIEKRGGTTRVPISTFAPSSHGLELNENLLINITIVNNYEDEDLTNNWMFKQTIVKNVFFRDDFEEGNIDGWTKETPYDGMNIWDVTDVEEFIYYGHSLYSGDKKDQVYPGSTAIVSPLFDIPVSSSAKLTYWHAYRFYYDYDGVIVEISTDGGTTWEAIAPSDRGDGEAGYSGPNDGIISNATENPLKDMQGWTFYDAHNQASHLQYGQNDWVSVEYDLSGFMGESDVKLRWHIGWSDIYSDTYEPYGYWLDNIIMSTDEILNIRPNATIDSITPSTARFDTEFTFNGSGSDSDGTVLAYEWFSSIDGFLSHDKQFNTTNLSSGYHTIYFRVQDDYGTWSNRDTAVLFAIPNSPPIGLLNSISPSPAKFNSEVIFNVTGYDSDGTIVGYGWKSNIDGFLSDEKAFNITELSLGTHIISFRVLDNDGYWSEWNTTELEIYPNAYPLATINSITSLNVSVYDPPHYRFDDVIVFRGTGSDSDGTIESHYWGYYSMETEGTIFLSDDEDFTFVFNQSCITSCHILYLVTDDSGDEATAIIQVHIWPNSIPNATIDHVSPPEARFDSDFYLSGVGTDSDGEITGYEWTSNKDGHLSNEANTIVTNLSVGEHLLTFRVEDNDGGWAEQNTTLVVYPNSPPVAYIENVEFQSKEDGYQIILEGHGEDDSKLTKYEWRAKDASSKEVVFQNTYYFNYSDNRTDQILDDHQLELELQRKFTIDLHLIFSLRAQDDDGDWSEWIEAGGQNLIYIDDGDGYDHSDDAFPFDKTQWSDLDFDGFGDNPNGNNPDAFPEDPYEWSDSDGDGIGDNSDILVDIPNSYAYISGLVFVVSLSAITMEMRARNSLVTTRDELKKLIEDGIEIPEVLTSIDGLDEVGGIILMSGPSRNAGSLLTETLSRQGKLLQTLEKVAILQDKTSQMKKEEIPVKDFVKEISKLEKQLLKEAKDDFGKKYLEKIHKRLLERMSEEVKQ